MSTLDDLVTIATFENTIEASVARGALEAAGIPAFVPGENLGVLTFSRTVPSQPCAELKVRLRDRDRAVGMLTDARHR